MFLFSVIAACTPDPGASGAVIYTTRPPDGDVWAAGDSITASSHAWPNNVSEPVYNIAMGYEGFVTTWVRPETVGERIDHYIDAFGTPRLIVVMAGRNDEQAGESLDDVLAAVDDLDSDLRGRGIDVRWVTPPGRVGLGTPLTDGIGEHLRATWPERTIDCGPLLGAPTGIPSLFESDGVHPNATGHGVLTDCVEDALGL